MSVLKILYYWADYVIGYLLKVLQDVFGQHFIFSIVIMMTSILIQNGTLMEDPDGYLFAGGFVVPKPNLIFFLDAEPEIIQARKKEVSFEECRRQSNAYRSLVPKTTEWSCG